MNRLRLLRTVAPPFESLLSGVMDRLWGFSLKLAGNEAEAEDLFQETVLKAYRAFNGLKDLDRFKPWIFQILHRHWLSARRSEARAPFVDLPLDEEFSASQGPWDLFAWATADGRFGGVVQEEVDKLLPEFRQVVWLRYVEDLDYREIAEILDITEGTVASRLFRAKGLLKERLWLFAKEDGWVREK